MRTPKSGNPAPRQKTTQGPAAPQHQSISRFEFFQLCIGVAGVVAVIAYTSVSYWQAGLTKQALVFGNRPFIYQTGISVGPRQNTPGVDGFPLMVIFQNSGNTAARRFTSHAFFKSFESPIDSTYGFPDIGSFPETPPGTIAPKSSIFTGPILIPMHILKGVQAHTSYAYIWGRAEYGDQLDRNEKHLTEVCLQIADVQGDLESTAPNNLVNITVQPCPFHNCTDEDCRKT